MRRLIEGTLVTGLLIVPAVVVLFYSRPVVAESRIRFQINVNISADPAIKTLVTSYLNRELRALGDVELVDMNAGIGRFQSFVPRLGRLGIVLHPLCYLR